MELMFWLSELERVRRVLEEVEAILEKADL